MKRVRKPQNYQERLIRFVETHDKLITAFTTILMLIVTCGVAYSTYSLYGATRDLVIGAQETAVKELRPYVYFKITATPYPPINPNRYAVILLVTNGGKTWARKLTIQTAIVEQPRDDQTDPFVAVQTKWKDKVAYPIVLGPGQTEDYQFGGIAFTEVPNIVKGNMRTSYLVWAQYEDSIGQPVKVRQTQMSMRLNGDTEGGISFGNLPTHNCADDDCPQ